MVAVHTCMAPMPLAGAPDFENPSRCWHMYATVAYKMRVLSCCCVFVLEDVFYAVFLITGFW